MSSRSQVKLKPGDTVGILGGGANTLIGDGGVPGITVKLPSGPEEIAGDLFTLGAGAPITRLVTLMKQHQRVGAEFLAGIPGTVGGAVIMNAGGVQLAKDLEAIGLRVIRLHNPELSKGGGSIRCTTLTLSNT